MDRELVLSVDDLLVYLKETAFEKVDLKTRIGFWVLWAIKEKELTSDEAEILPSIIGNYLEKVVADLS